MKDVTQDISVSDEQDRKLLKALYRLTDIARNQFDGHFTIMRFTTNWRVGFDTPERYEDILRMSEGETFYDAAVAALADPKSCFEPLASYENRSEIDEICAALRDGLRTGAPRSDSDFSQLAAGVLEVVNARREREDVGTWPDPKNPGVPPNPHRDGFYWLRWKSGTPTIAQWYGRGLRAWVISYLGGFVEPSRLAHLDYVGPAEPPAK